jgi:hypothetical protein
MKPFEMTSFGMGAIEFVEKKFSPRPKFPGMTQ